MNIKTLTGSVPKGRTNLFKTLDSELAAFDQEATEIRLELQSEIEELKRTVNTGNQSDEKKRVLLNLMEEKSDMIKPVLQDILTQYGDELSADKVRKIEDFLNYSLPEGENGMTGSLTSGMDLSQLKGIFENGVGGATNLATVAARGMGDATKGLVDAARNAGTAAGLASGLGPPKEGALDVALAEGEVPFLDEIDLSHEIEHWGQAFKPVAKNSALMQAGEVTAYKFNIRYDNIKAGTVPTYHLDLDEEYQPTVIRFHAGEPYQDIAYRISPKSWFLNEELGFKNSFKDGVFILHFNLKD